jgi:hypothetical protein
MLLFGSILLKHGRHFDCSNQPLNMRMRVCYLHYHEARLCCYLVICCFLPASYLLSLLFGRQNGGSVFLWNVGELLSDYIASHPTR